MALLGVQPWEEIGDFKFQAIAEGKNLDVVLQGWNLRDSISDEALDLLQVRVGEMEREISVIEASGWKTRENLRLATSMFRFWPIKCSAKREQANQGTIICFFLVAGWFSGCLESETAVVTHDSSDVNGQ